jgi:putative transmembrane protein Alph_Pro_TM
MRHNIYTSMLTGVVLAAALTLLNAGNASAQLTAKANHDHITIDFFYNGSEVTVRGICDPDVDLAVKITSPEGHQELKKKGKVAGFLWMNVGSLDLEKTPNLYYLQSTKKMEELLPVSEAEKYTIGYPALAKHVEMGPAKDQAERDKWFAEFVKFKENQNLYTSNVGGFTMKDENGTHTYFMKFKWPYQAAPGDYLVTVYAVKGGKVVEQATSGVMVEQVGSVKALAGMAKNNGALYGFLSVLSALGAGFGVGLVFRKGGGAH